MKCELSRTGPAKAGYHRQSGNVARILAYSVQQRTRDFGVRRALGATSSDVLQLVVRDALKVIAIGAAIGLIASAMLGLTTAISIAGPAWRAARIDPAVALRSK